MHLTIIIVLLGLIQIPALAATSGCKEARGQRKASLELQKIRTEDQADRAWLSKLKPGESPDPEKIKSMNANDERRRRKIEEFLLAGCLKSAEDHEAAFMVMQHGTSSEHYLKALHLIKEAQKLSKKNLKNEVAMAADRYLVSTGKKQIFGTQASMSGPGGCWCIQPIEESVPASLQEEYRGGLNAPYTGLPYLDILNKGRACTNSFCSSDLTSTPKGTLPGIW